MECDKCRLCEEHRETVHYRLFGCKKLAGAEYVKRHNSTLKVLAVKWAVENGLLPEDTKWYTMKWERGKVIEKEGKKFYWYWEHPVRTECIVRRPDFTLEDTSNKTILLNDMACPNEHNKKAKRTKRLRSTIDYALKYKSDKEVTR